MRGHEEQGEEATGEAHGWWRHGKKALGDGGGLLLQSAVLGRDCGGLR